MAETVAGGNRSGDGSHQLNSPEGIFVDDDQTLYVADRGNHRIVAWKAGATTGVVVAGGRGAGDGLDQLHSPTHVIVDRQTDSLLISDGRNRRVVRWPRRLSSGGMASNVQGELIIDGIGCAGLAIDEEGALYVADDFLQEVRRYDKGGKDKQGTLVAGARGEGRDFKHLNGPQYIFVDSNCTVYVSDQYNSRVMKWKRGAKEGAVVAGGNGQGWTTVQLSLSKGVWADGDGNVYVTDAGHRVMRWEKGAKEGTVIAGGNGRGEGANQFYETGGLFFDRHDNLYVADRANNRIQRFSLLP